MLFFLEFSITRRMGTKRNDNFIFSIPRPFPTDFGLDWSHNGIFWFFDFFFLFLEFSITCRVRTERKENFYFFLFFGLFQPIFAWNEAITVSFNLLNFFAIFFEFSLTRRVGMKRNDDFYFLSLSLFQPILAWNAAEIVFFIIFWKILLFFWNFLVRVGMERNRTIIFVFSLSRPFPPYFGFKRSHNGIF